MISGTSKTWSKSGPVALRIMTKMLQKIQEQIWEHPKKHIIFVNLGLEHRNFQKMYVPGTMSFVEALIK